MAQVNTGQYYSVNCPTFETAPQAVVDNKPEFATALREVSTSKQKADALVDDMNNVVNKINRQLDKITNVMMNIKAAENAGQLCQNNCDKVKTFAENMKVKLTNKMQRLGNKMQLGIAEADKDAQDWLMKFYQAHKDDEAAMTQFDKKDETDSLNNMGYTQN